MAKRIALFNPKGGMGKTTATFNLGWMLASKGKRVILVDTDPQTSLTELVLGYKDASELQRFYEEEPERNLKAGLAPSFEYSTSLVEAIDCIPVGEQEGLFLLPGHIGLSEYEIYLALAQNLSGHAYSLQHMPGSISVLLEKTAKKMQADYVLVDMNPSLSSFNQNVLMTSDYFIIPTVLDYISIMAIDSLIGTLPKWHRWSEAAQSTQILREAAYPFPCVSPKFMGSIILNLHTPENNGTQGVQINMDVINDRLSERLLPALKQIGMALPEDKYYEHGIENYCLTSIPNFRSLISISQKEQTPIFELTLEQIGRAGKAYQRVESQWNEFAGIFSELANEVIGLTDDASSD